MPPPSKPVFVAYYRVSTPRQGESGLGLEAQRETVTRHVQAVGGEVLAEGTDLMSGRRRDRPELAAADIRPSRLLRAGTSSPRMSSPTSPNDSPASWPCSRSEGDSGGRGRNKSVYPHRGHRRCPCPLPSTASPPASSGGPSAWS